MELVGTEGVYAPLGACCDGDTPDCRIETPWDCKDAGDIYQGDGTYCKVCTDGPAFLNSCGPSCDKNSQNWKSACRHDTDCYGSCNADSTNEGDPCITNADCTVCDETSDNTGDPCTNNDQCIDTCDENSDNDGDPCTNDDQCGR
jgi:hypothetical protein